MNRLPIVTILFLMAGESLAQGTLLLSTAPNDIGSLQSIAAPIFAPTLVGQLHVGSTAGSLSPVGTVTPLILYVDQYNEYRYWRDGSTMVVPLAPGATGFAQLWVWSAYHGTSPDEAAQNGGWAGKSEIFAVQAGGEGTPPSPPGRLGNFRGFLVPEPSTFALAVLGLAALSYRRHQRD
jgi:hypothetical protein